LAPFVQRATLTGSLPCHARGPQPLFCCSLPSLSPPAARAIIPPPRPSSLSRNTSTRAPTT